MSTAAPARDQCVVIDGVRWSTYLALVEDGVDRRGRLTYDRGVLEIVSPSMGHEQIACLIGRLIEVFTEDRGIEIVSVASMTVKLEALQSGFEADEAYYIQRADAVRGRDELDFTVDPAPDLVIEVDVSRSSLSKLSLCAAFRVPEVWHYWGEALTVHVLQGDAYAPATQSRVLPGFPVDELTRVVARRANVGETQLVRAFRASLGAHFAG